MRLRVRRSGRVDRLGVGLYVRQSAMVRLDQPSSVHVSEANPGHGQCVPWRCCTKGESPLRAVQRSPLNSRSAPFLQVLSRALSLVAVLQWQRDVKRQLEWSHRGAAQLLGRVRRPLTRKAESGSCHPNLETKIDQSET